MRSTEYDDPLEDHMAFLAPAVLCYAFYYVLCAGHLAPGVGFAILIGVIINVTRYHWSQVAWYRVNPLTTVSRALFIVAVALIPLTFHIATGEAVIGLGKQMRDHTLVAVDTKLMGWAWPKGQLALFAQSHASISPDQPLGLLLTEIFQITYISYYVWGNGMLLYLLACVVARPSSPAHWWRMRMASYAMAGAYMLTFVINFAIPAMSPRLYLHSEYTVELKGLLVARTLNEALKKGAGGDPTAPTTFGAFPSGHVGLTWLPVLVARRLGFVTYARIAAVGAVSMTFAVLYLRYHYFSDALVAIIVLVPTGLYTGRLLPYQMQEDSVYLKYNPARTDDLDEP